MSCADSKTVKEIQEIQFEEQRDPGRESGASGESGQWIKQNRQANSLFSLTLPLIQWDKKWCYDSVVSDNK